MPRKAEALQVRTPKYRQENKKIPVRKFPQQFKASQEARKKCTQNTTNSTYVVLDQEAVAKIMKSSESNFDVLDIDSQLAVNVGALNQGVYLERVL